MAKTEHNMTPGKIPCTLEVNFLFLSSTILQHAVRYHCICLYKGNNLCGTHQLLVYVHDVDIFDEATYCKEKHRIFNSC